MSGGEVMPFGTTGIDTALREIQKEALEILKRMEKTQKALDFQTKVLLFLTFVLAVETAFLILQ
jgi:hypothetical protein